MSIRPVRALLLSLLLVPSPTLAQRQMDDPDAEAVVEVISRLAEALEAGDMSAAEVLFPERGLHILADDATTHGWAEYRDGYLQAELTLIQGLGYAHTRIEPVVRGGVAWVSFRREVSGSPPSPFEGRGTAVLEKRDDRWLIVHLHLSR